MKLGKRIQTGYFFYFWNKIQPKERKLPPSWKNFFKLALKRCLEIPVNWCFIYVAILTPIIYVLNQKIELGAFYILVLILKHCYRAYSALVLQERFIFVQNFKKLNGC